ncbi:MAG: glutaredoxin domain-containing protein [Bacteroidales bacterium]|jgi:glutaredoxin-like YruB-family protein|nr:glutaredoxin domain-containing protein [Bacteroidales bacterium]
MNILNITSQSDLKYKLNNKKKTFLLLYKEGSEQSMCSIENLTNASNTEENIQLLKADVTNVRDIHSEYNITTVPSLLEFDGNKYVNIIKGCHNSDYYTMLMGNNLYSAKTDSSLDTAKQVIVYSTPSCPHCTTLKNYLKQYKINFRDIDISKNQKMAQELVRKSGQQGVPQTEINGRIIVGFDKSKIDKTLNIKNN